MDNHHDVHNKLSIWYHLFTHIINSKSSSSYKYAKMSTSGNMNLSTYFYTNPQLSFDNCDHLLQTKQWLVFGQYSQSNCKLKSTFNFNFTYYHSLVMVITNYLYRVMMKIIIPKEINMSKSLRLSGLMPYFTNAQIPKLRKIEHTLQMHSVITKNTMNQLFSPNVLLYGSK